MRQRELLAYVRKNLPDALRAVQTGRRAVSLPQLTSAEKALIYYYTEDGYWELNARLHVYPGPNTSVFGQGLATALTKLSAYEGAVNSSAFRRPPAGPNFPRVP